MCFNNRNTLGPYCGLNHSRGADIPLRVCRPTFKKNACASQTERGE